MRDASPGASEGGDRRARRFGVRRREERERKGMTDGPRVSVSPPTAAHQPVRRRDVGTGRALGRWLGRLLGRKRARAGEKGKLGRLASGPAGLLLFLLFLFVFQFIFKINFCLNSDSI